MTASTRRRRCARRLLAAVAASGLAAVFGASAPAGEVIDRVRATVGGHLILASDVEAARMFGLVTVDDAAGEEVLSRLIDRALILGEVDRYAPPEPEDEAVAREVQAVRARFDTPDEFTAALARAGIEETHLREWLRQDLRVMAYLDERFVVTPPGEDEIAAIYARDAARLTRQGIPVTFEEARPAIVRAIEGERRAARVDEWVAGLRRRTPIVTR
jgi:hypothetical protein